MATLQGEPVDRAAVNFYEIGGFKVDSSDPDEFNIYNDPSWQPLLPPAENHTDIIRIRSPDIDTIWTLRAPAKNSPPPSRLTPREHQRYDSEL